MDYLRHVQSAVDFIEDNLLSDITFVEAAQAAGFSPFHFHRVFLSLVGDSVTDYIRGRRMTLAAQALIGSDSRVLDIALDHRYGSDASFTRAFRKAYSLTPSQYRKLGKPLVLLERACLTAERLRTLATTVTEPRRVRIGEIAVVGLHYRGTNNRNEIPHLWTRFVRRIPEIPARVAAGVTLGVCAPIGHLTIETEVSYLACVEAEADSRIPTGMVRQILAPQTYVVFTHRGSAESLGETYQHIYGTYFPRTGLCRAEAPDFERYDHRFDVSSADSEMEIYIPLQG